MTIRILPHGAQLSGAVHEFNLRMMAGGMPWGFYVDPAPDWLRKQPGQNVWREYYVAVENGSAVRGGFALKPQDWWLRGGIQVVTDWQGPVSEGAVNPKYATLAVRLIREMLSLRPALYSWGHGGNEQPVVQILRKMGWLIHDTPFCLMVLRPARFLRHNVLLRRSAFRRVLLDLLAFSGAGAAGLAGLHALLRLRSGRRFGARATEFAEFGPWADALWERCRNRYLAIAVRDAASMNVIASTDTWPTLTRLRVERTGADIGWVLVMDTPMRGDERFGDLRVGSIVDCLADPSDAGEVVAAATAYLRRRGVDLIVSNQSHPAWIGGFADNGYLLLPKRRLFVASPALRQLLEPFPETASGLHLTNMDGHGPHGL